MNNVLDYGSLENDVRTWCIDHAENVRRLLGDEYAEATRRDLEADPWLALRGYVEDARSI